MRCPACADAQLDRHGNCNTCGGVWLPEEHVEARLASSLAFSGGGYGERHCPMCDETMNEPLIFDVPIDHCPAHGMWFDKKELDLVIQRSRVDGFRAGPKAKPEDSLKMLVAAVHAWKK